MTAQLALLEPAYTVDGEGQAVRACEQVDPEVMFPDEKLDNRHPDVQRAKAVCARCRFQPACAEEALDNRVEYGVWGGMSWKDRQAALRRRSRDAARLPGR